MDINDRMDWIRRKVAEAKINEYGKTYLAHLSTSYNEYGEHGMKVQVLYIVSNCRFPKGSTARKELLEYGDS